MKSSLLPCTSLLLIAAGCVSETPAGCPVPGAPGSVESVEVGLLPDIGDPDALVAWQDGDVAPLEYGLQGSLMLVAGVAVRGDGFDDANGLPIELTLSTEDQGVVAQSDRGGYWTADDGSLFGQQSYLIFFDVEPEDGDVLHLRLQLACFEIERTLVADRPELQPRSPGRAATDLDRGAGNHDP